MAEDVFDKIKRTLDEVAEEMRQLSAFQKKTEKEIDKVAKEIDIGGGLRRAAEGLAAPSVPKVFKKLGFRINAVHQRVKALQNGQVIAEVDLICPGTINGERIVLIGEVKAHLIVEYIQWFLEDDLANFKEYFPEYKDFKIYGLVAGLSIDNDAVKFASKQGLYVLAPSGEIMKAINPPDFEPRVW